MFEFCPFADFSPNLVCAFSARRKGEWYCGLKIGNNKIFEMTECPKKLQKKNKKRKRSF